MTPVPTPSLAHFEHTRLAEAPLCETLSIIERAMDELTRQHDLWGHLEDFDRHLFGLTYDGLDATRNAIRAALPNVARLLARSDFIAAQDDAEAEADDLARAPSDPSPQAVRTSL